MKLSQAELQAIYMTQQGPLPAGAVGVHKYTKGKKAGQYYMRTKKVSSVSSNKYAKGSLEAKQRAMKAVETRKLRKMAQM